MAIMRTSTPVEWTRKRYHETLKNIGAGSNAIVVNFDQVGPLEEQISRASEDFSLVPHAASDFLVKPADEMELVNLPKLGLHLDRLSQVSVIGIAAREAGDSLLTRCCSIVMLRDMLNEAGLDTPIHVFGAINPYEVLAYFFCGADIFDGLNWLRCLFRSSGSIPIGDSATEDFQWNLTDSELRTQAWTRNLRFLFQLQEGMQQFGAGGSLDSLLEEFPMARRTARIALYCRGGYQEVRERGMCGRSRQFVPRPMPTLTDEQVNAYLRERLRDYNERDTEAINRHIRGLRDALEQSGADVLPTRFGGSVSRHTYVDGLSDVDVLLTVNDSSLSGRDPRAVIQRMAALIQQRMPRDPGEDGPFGGNRHLRRWPRNPGAACDKDQSGNKNSKPESAMSGAGYYTRNDLLRS